MRSCDVHSFLCKKIPRNSQEAAATQLYTALKLEPAAADMAHDWKEITLKVIGNSSTQSWSPSDGCITYPKMTFQVLNQKILARLSQVNPKNTKITKGIVGLDLR